MVKKKPARRKKIVAGRKPAAKRRAAKRTRVARKKVAKKKPVAKQKKSARRKRSAPGAQLEVANPLAKARRRGLGPASGGQSGDTQGLSRIQLADSESVEELQEEGQYLEAETVSGVEGARDADEGDIRTSEVAEDDVPLEYRDRD